MGAERRFSL